MSLVIDRDECPSRLEMTAISAPEAIIRKAC